MTSQRMSAAAPSGSEGAQSEPPLTVQQVAERLKESDRNISLRALVSVTRLQKPEESVQRPHEGQVDIWERLARLEGERVRGRPRLWAPEERAE